MNQPITARLMVPAGDDSNGVFSCYNPNLLRMPMQIAFSSDDQKLLNQALQVAISGIKAYDHIQVGTTLYVEYVPKDLARYDVPDENWEIKLWRLNHKSK